ncbi:hypothetical protein [Paraclostridium bifermentans]|uniref:hypothetical protein n=1 Tax=Paraclostridium bifermentans TaxID=1490 RepID=UPI001897440F|nr:hypothetical protein [Paraclostridium bifermentans]
MGEDLINNYPEDAYEKVNKYGSRKKIREKDKSCEIIFITGVIDYLQDGYEFRVYRYLLNPIKFVDLKKHTISSIKEVFES